MVFFVMERKRRMYCCNPELPRDQDLPVHHGVFIMRQTRIQILGCGRSLHLADWMQHRATWQWWEARIQKKHPKVDFKTVFFFIRQYSGEIPHMRILGEGCGNGLNRWLLLIMSSAHSTTSWNASVFPHETKLRNISARTTPYVTAVWHILQDARADIDAWRFVLCRLHLPTCSWLLLFLSVWVTHLCCTVTTDDLYRLKQHTFVLVTFVILSFYYFTIV